MIESLRIASPAGPSITLPSESGPRWTSVSFIAASAAGSGPETPSRETRPHIPHMGASLESAQDRAEDVQITPLPIPTTEGQADDPGHGRAEHTQVEPNRAVRDVLEVVDQLVLPGVLARDPGLGEACDAGPDDEPLPVLGNLLTEAVEEGRPDRARSDDAHIAADHVEELGHLVEMGQAGRPAHHGHLLLRAPAELLAVVRAEAILCARCERPELVHGEDAAGAANPLAAVEDRPARCDQGGQGKQGEERGE